MLKWPERLSTKNGDHSDYVPRLPPTLPVLGERRVVDAAWLPVLGECWSAGLRRRACAIVLATHWLERVG